MITIAEGNRISRIQMEGIRASITLMPGRHDHELMVTSVEVAKRYRGKGVGSELLRELCAYADVNQFELVLCVCADASGGLSNEALTEWYARHGFKAWRGDSWMMTRWPRCSVPQR